MVVVVVVVVVVFIDPFFAGGAEADRFGVTALIGGRQKKPLWIY